MTVGGEIIRIGFSVTADKRTGRVLRILPPVVTFGIEVVNTSCASLGTGGCDGHRYGLQCSVRPFQGFSLQELAYLTFHIFPGHHRGEAEEQYK